MQEIKYESLRIYQRRKRMKIIIILLIMCSLYCEYEDRQECDPEIHSSKCHQYEEMDNDFYKCVKDDGEYYFEECPTVTTTVSIKGE